MLNSPEKPKPTDEQIAILDRFRTTDDNLLINALAGGGKTTMLEMMMQNTALPTLYLAFNKSVITDAEANERIPSGVKARTFNSMGLQCWREGNGRAVTDLKKTFTILQETINGLKGKDREDAWEEYSDISAACKMARHLGYIPEGKFKGARRLCDRETLCRKVENRLSALGLEVLDAFLYAAIKASYAGSVDFDDQVYMPALFGGSFPRFPLVLVDERQDLSPVNDALLDKLVKERVCCVGDRWQAIYGFRGAETDGMDKSKAKFNMEEMSLSYSFRCPENIVKAVHWHVPHMKWIKSGGIYTELQSLDPATIPEGATIICRNNAPLFRAAFALLSRKRSVQVAGSDIGPKIIRLLSKIGVPGDSSEDLMFKIDAWREAQLQKSNSPDTTNDTAECLKVFASWGNSYDQAIGYIKHVFAQQGTIQLTTGHRAKGLEWDTVYHLDKQLLGKGGQDLNLKYVITTRAKQELYEIKTEELQW